MAEKRRQFTREFKLEAVRLICSGGYCRAASQGLGPMSTDLLAVFGSAPGWGPFSLSMKKNDQEAQREARGY